MLGGKNFRERQETPCKIFIQLREKATVNCSGFVGIGGVKHKIFRAQFL
jgi:hypothetical protein